VANLSAIEPEDLIACRYQVGIPCRILITSTEVNVAIGFDHHRGLTYQDIDGIFAE
jgi:hypothetical protein